MEQLERPDVVGDRNQRNREIERIADQRPQIRLGNLVAQQMRADDGADCDDVAGGRANRGELMRGERIEPLGHIQTAIGRSPREQRVDERHRG
jgi:hypothetical protein